MDKNINIKTDFLTWLKEMEIKNLNEKFKSLKNFENLTSKFIKEVNGKLIDIQKEKIENKLKNFDSEKTESLLKKEW